MSYSGLVKSPEAWEAILAALGGFVDVTGEIR